MSREVVVTGRGVVTSVGTGADEFVEALLAGASGVRQSSEEGAPATAPCADFDPEAWMTPKEARRTDRFAQLAMAAAKTAMSDSGINMAEENLDRFGVLVSSGIGGLKTLEDQYTVLLTKGPQRVSAFTIPMLISNMASGLISMEFGMRGPNMCIVTACATSNNAIGESWRMIKFGDADVFLAGGSEAAIRNTRPASGWLLAA